MRSKSSLNKAINKVVDRIVEEFVDELLDLDENPLKFSAKLYSLTERYVRRESLCHDNEADDVFCPRSEQSNLLIQEIVERFAYDNYQAVLNKFEEDLTEYVRGVINYIKSNESSNEIQFPI